MCCPVWGGPVPPYTLGATIEFFLGHMEVIKRVRNLYAHMFPCITKADCTLAKREIRTLGTHINDRLKRYGAVA